MTNTNKKNYITHNFNINFFIFYSENLKVLKLDTAFDKEF